MAPSTHKTLGQDEKCGTYGNPKSEMMYTLPRPDSGQILEEIVRDVLGRSHPTAQLNAAQANCRRVLTSFSAAPTTSGGLESNVS